MKMAVVDQRVLKTRTACLGALRDLIQSHHYDDVRICDITQRARISRSTFYEHFSSKDDLLAASIAGPFAVLADAMSPAANPANLVTLLEHFWANRRLARAVLIGSIRRGTVAVLVSQIEKRLKDGGLARRGSLILPTRLAAIQLAELLLAPITAWLNGESRCSAEILAAALRRVSGGALIALKAGAP